MDSDSVEEDFEHCGKCKKDKDHRCHEDDDSDSDSDEEDFEHCGKCKKDKEHKCHEDGDSDSDSDEEDFEHCDKYKKDKEHKCHEDDDSYSDSDEEGKCDICSKYKYPDLDIKDDFMPCSECNKDKMNGNCQEFTINMDKECHDEEKKKNITYAEYNYRENYEGDRRRSENKASSRNYFHDKYLENCDFGYREPMRSRKEEDFLKHDKKKKKKHHKH